MAGLSTEYLSQWDTNLDAFDPNWGIDMPDDDLLDTFSPQSKQNPSKNFQSLIDRLDSPLAPLACIENRFSVERSWNTVSAEPSSSNEASPPSQHQEMESSGSGAPAASVLSEDTHTTQAAATGLTSQNLHLDDASIYNSELPFQEGTDAMFSFPSDMPLHMTEQDYVSPSDVLADNKLIFAAGDGAPAEQDPAGTEAQPQASPTSSGAAVRAANTLANFNKDLDAVDDHVGSLAEVPARQACPDLDDETTPTFTEEQQRRMWAYAKFTFGDGDYFVRSKQVEIGRDQAKFEEYMEQLRLQKAQENSQRAEDALRRYEQEPSAQSQPGDGDNAPDPSSKSSHSLEGRPQQALPSNNSEQGGAVSQFVQSDNEMDRKRRKRRRRRGLQLNSKSSSTTSVVPADLHPREYEASFVGPENPAVAPDCVFVPVYPDHLPDIKKMSKKHLLIAFDEDEEHWVLNVLGANAMWSDGKGEAEDVVLYRGDTMVLNDFDRVTVYSFSMMFRLPDLDREMSPSGISQGTFKDEVEADQEVDGQGEDVEDVVEDVKPGKGKPKPKIKLGKLAQRKNAAEESGTSKKSDKAKQKEESLELSPEAVKKPDKGKKPKTAAKEPADASEQAESGAQQVEDAEKPKKPSPAPAPLEFEPGSLLYGLPPEKIPQRRKGPGRPPKNGVISKRDMAFIRRRQREQEKEGKPVQEIDELLPIVRWEQKQRELAQKAQAAGQPAPPQTEMPTGVVQSIETVDGQVNGPGSASVQPAEGAVAGANGTQRPSTSVPAEGFMRQASSPGPKRVAKTPSPVPPESTFTEDQLKKPNKTYLHQIDDVLQEIGNGDLQDIYDKIMKKWPYYKYKVDTTGWQSSVRHNLLGNPHFIRCGKSGKGALWRINPEVPLEREKKRARLSPSAKPQQMPNGQYPPAQGGQYPTYGAYGQPGVPPQHFPGGQQQMPNGAYASPYGAGAHGQQHQTPQQQQQQPRPVSQQPQNELTPIVNDIVAYRGRYLAQWPNGSAEQDAQEKKVSKCINIISALFQNDGVGERPQLTDPDEVRIYRELDQVMEKHLALKKASRTPSQQPPGQANGGAAPQVQGSAVAGPSSVLQTHAQPQGQVQGQAMSPATAAVANPQPNGYAQNQMQGQVQHQHTQANGPVPMPVQQSAAPVPGAAQQASRSSMPAPAPAPTMAYQTPVQGTPPANVQQPAGPVATASQPPAPTAVPAPAPAPTMPNQVQHQGTPSANVQPTTAAPSAAPVNTHDAQTSASSAEDRLRAALAPQEQASSGVSQDSNAASTTGAAVAGIKRAASGDAGDEEQDVKRLRTNE